MKKSEVIKIIDKYNSETKRFLTNLINTLQRGHIYKVTNIKKMEHSLFRVTHFYKGGIRTKVLCTTLFSRITLSALHKWTFNWPVLASERYIFEEVPIEDLPLYVNETLSPYYKQTLGHTLTKLEELDWVGKKNDPILAIAKKIKILRAKRLTSLGRSIP